VDKITRALRASRRGGLDFDIDLDGLDMYHAQRRANRRRPA
jgi:hypothetical protein